MQRLGIRERATEATTKGSLGEFRYHIEPSTCTSESTARAKPKLEAKATSCMTCPSQAMAEAVEYEPRLRPLFGPF